MIFREWLLWQRDRSDDLGFAVREACGEPSWLLEVKDDCDFHQVMERVGLGILYQRILGHAFDTEWWPICWAYHNSLGLPWAPWPNEVPYIGTDTFGEREPEYCAGMERLFGTHWMQHEVPWMPKDRPGYVYVMRTDNGFYKIGRTKYLDSRFKAVDLVVPFELELIRAYKTDDCYELERQYHKRYAKYHVKGEWFRIDEAERPLPAFDEIFTYFADWTTNVPDEFALGVAARMAS